MADHALFISIHAPHARSDSIRALDILPLRISIHAPHARSDSSKQVSQPVSVISIHAPHARSDLRCKGPMLSSFISIHAPHARSDSSVGTSARSPTYFNPRSSCEERLSRHRHAIRVWYFNPRSSCEERLAAPRALRRAGDFNPRSSCEERHTSHQGRRHRREVISIHAPHARSDEQKQECGDMSLKFQSTLLMRGATSANYIYTKARAVFQSTLLMRGATCIAVTYFFLGNISIHAPHARSD